jgi:hypothetical protein
MKSAARTVPEYLASLPGDRRSEIETVRRTLLTHLGAGFEEGMQYGMIGYYVPHRLYPPGYHCDPRQPLPFAALASQKNHLSLYLMSEYVTCDSEGAVGAAVGEGGQGSGEGSGGEGGESQGSWLRTQCAARGVKLDMGKSCIRFKRAAELPLDLIGQAIARVSVESWVRVHEAIRDRQPTPRPKAKTQAMTKAQTKPMTKAKVQAKAKAKAPAGAPTKGHAQVEKKPGSSSVTKASRRPPAGASKPQRRATSPRRR